MTIDTEDFRQCVCNPNYAVGNRGSVMRITPARGARVGRVLRGYVCNSGYKCVMLYENDVDRTHLVHRLVAETWIGPAPAGADVNHIDGDKLNNCVENLEYATRSENQRHAYANDMNRYVEVKRRLSQSDRTAIICGIESASEAAEKYGVTPGYVYTLRRKSKAEV